MTPDNERRRKQPVLFELLRTAWMWHDFQDHAQRHADDAVQFLRSRHPLPGRCSPLRGIDPGGRRELLRDNGVWRGCRLRDGLQDYGRWDAHDTLQLLFAEGLPGR